MDKFTRLLNLVALLERASQPMTAEEIARALGEYGGDHYAGDESARRKFERDKDDLVSMGVPLTYETLPFDPSSGGYVIRQEATSIPDPGFTGPELAALHFAATAMDLRDERSGDVADAADGLRKFGGLGRGGAESTMAELRLDANLVEIFTAIVQSRPLLFTYRGRTRRVLPWQVVNRAGYWYLLCLDLDEGTPRTYRLDRLESRTLAFPDHDEDPLVAAAVEAGGRPGGDQDLRFRPWEFGTGDAEEVLVRLDAPAAAVALMEDPALDVVTSDDPATVLKLAVRNPAGLWNCLLSFLDRAELVSPPEWRDDFVEVLRSLADPDEGAR